MMGWEDDVDVARHTRGSIKLPNPVTWPRHYSTLRVKSKFISAPVC